MYSIPYSTIASPASTMPFFTPPRRPLHKYKRKKLLLRSASFTLFLPPSLSVSLSLSHTHTHYLSLVPSPSLPLHLSHALWLPCSQVNPPLTLNCKHSLAHAHTAIQHPCAHAFAALHPCLPPGNPIYNRSLPSLTLPPICRPLYLSAESLLTFTGTHRVKTALYVYNTYIHT